MTEDAKFEGRGIVNGMVTGPALVSRTPFSFLGDVDIRTGDVIGELSDLKGRNIAGQVLIVPATRGSAGAWRFLHQLKQHGTHPLAIITGELPDPSVVQGAILSGIPIVSGLADRIGNHVTNGSNLQVNGNSGIVTIKTD